MRHASNAPAAGSVLKKKYSKTTGCCVNVSDFTQFKIVLDRKLNIAIICESAVNLKR